MRHGLTITLFFLEDSIPVRLVRLIGATALTLLDTFWEPPHNRHRNGRSVDVSRKAWNKTTGAIQYLSKAMFQKLLYIAVEKLHMHRIREGTIHFELMPLLPADPCHP